jgi:hypothetical protein
LIADAARKNVLAIIAEIKSHLTKAEWKKVSER